MAKAEIRKRVGRYQQKMKMGLVPSRYNFDSKSFHEGAHKHWARVHPHHVDAAVANDREYLKRARENR